MDMDKIKKIVEVLYKDDVERSDEIVYEYDDEIEGQIVRVKRYESALPRWCKDRAKRRRTKYE